MASSSEAKRPEPLTDLLRCATHGYTLHSTCPVCHAPTARSGPAKYSPQDAYGAYRRKLKLMDRAKQGKQA